MSERVSSHACTRIAKLLSGHTKLERDLAADLLDARTRAKELEEALREIEVQTALSKGLATRALRGENRPLDVSGPNGGENSPLERGEEKG
jgi:hypothetical protein